MNNCFPDTIPDVIIYIIMDMKKEMDRVLELESIKISIITLLQSKHNIRKYPVVRIYIPKISKINLKYKELQDIITSIDETEPFKGLKDSKKIAKTGKFFHIKNSIKTKIKLTFKNFRENISLNNFCKTMRNNDFGTIQLYDENRFNELDLCIVKKICYDYRAQEFYAFIY